MFKVAVDDFEDHGAKVHVFFAYLPFAFDELGVEWDLKNVMQHPESDWKPEVIAYLDVRNKHPYTPMIPTSVTDIMITQQQDNIAERHQLYGDEHKPEYDPHDTIYKSDDEDSDFDSRYDYSGNEAYYGRHSDEEDESDEEEFDDQEGLIRCREFVAEYWQVTADLEECIARTFNVT